MTPVPDEYYYDSVKIIGLSEKYFPFKETPLASVIKYYYNFSEPKFANDRLFQAFWVIKENKLFFEYAQLVDSQIKYSFSKICQNEIMKSEELILADWFSGKITIETDFTWGFIDEKGSFPDIRTLRVYTINKGRITYMVEECEFLDPMPF